MALPPEDLEALRSLLATARHGVLCTAHGKHAGWPFGSLAPYALSAERDPVFLFSDLAEHTHNLRAEPRSSLFVQDPAAREQPAAGARATLMGRTAVPEGAARAAALECYLARFPEAKAWATAHDFAPYVLRVERVRWIRGFGAMGWCERGDLP